MSNNSIADQPTVSTTLRIGSVLAKTFSVFGRQFWKLLVLALPPIALFYVYSIFMLPRLFPQFRLLPVQPALVVFVLLVNYGLSGIPRYVLETIAEGMITYGALQAMRGQPFTLGQSLAPCLRRLLLVVGIAVSSALITTLGAILIVPGAIAACTLYVAIPVCVIEKHGVFSSLGRSVALTKGNRWAIFGLLLLVGAVGLIVNFSLTYIVPLQLAAPGQIRAQLTLVLLVIRFAWLIVATAFGAVLATVVYHDLRAAKEGFDADKLAAVFD
jgi:hypothetical protein